MRGGEVKDAVRLYRGESTGTEVSNQMKRRNQARNSFAETGGAAYDSSFSRPHVPPRQTQLAAESNLLRPHPTPHLVGHVCVYVSCVNDCVCLYTHGQGLRALPRVAWFGAAVTASFVNQVDET